MLTEKSNHEDSTVFHVTHWKAGSQWIYKILNALAPERIVPPRIGEAQLLFTPLKSGAIYPAVYLTRGQLQSLTLPAKNRKFVIIRDLRDTLVSAYYSLRYSHAPMASSIASL